MWTLLYWLGPLLTIPLLAITLVLSVRAIWRTVTRPRLRGAAVCGRCSYEVGGLSQLSCPECGGDLRETGIRTRAWETKRRGNLFWALMGFGFIVYLVGAVVGVALVRAATSPITMPATGTYSTQTTFTTTSPAISSIRTDSVMRYGRAQQQTRVTARLFLVGVEDVILEFDSARGAFDMKEHDGEVLLSGATYTHGALEEALAAWGVDLGDAATASDVADLARLVDLTLVMGWTDGTRLSLSGLRIANQSRTSSNPSTKQSRPGLAWLWDPVMATTFVVVVGLIVWVIGGALIFDRRRKLLWEAGWGAARRPVAEMYEERREVDDG